VGQDCIAVREINGIAKGETDGLLVGLRVGLEVGFVASVECIIIRYNNKVSNTMHSLYWAFDIFNFNLTQLNTVYIQSQQQSKSTDRQTVK
jgi:hypothetical protein